MDGFLLLILVSLGVIIPVGSVLGTLAFIHRNRQQARIDRLERELADLQYYLRASDSADPASATPSVQPQTTSSKEESGFSAQASTRAERTRSVLARRIRENWMVWLGGLSVGLAGIFMVSHSISIGLIGPTQQFVMALMTGVALHLGSEYLRRRSRGTDQVFAALAGGGSITVYAALLAGVHHFQLIGPVTALTLLAITSLVTMALALVHGPVLAVMGLSGAYLVPILVGGEGGNIPFLLGYSFVITLSSLSLMRYVFRPWLWHTTLAGASLWWWLSAAAGPSEAAVAWYLTALLLAFGGLAPSHGLKRARHREALLMLLAVWGVSVARQPEQAPFFWSWLLIIPAAILLPQSRRQFWYLPWVAVLSSAAGWLVYRIDSLAVRPDLQGFVTGCEAGFISYLIAATLLATGLSLWQWRQQGDRRRWVSLCLLTPLVWLTLGWLLLHGHGTSGSWAVWTLLLGALYGLTAWQIERRGEGRIAVVFAILAAHTSYSLAVVMWLRDASLTLALSAQFISLAWLARRYQMPELYWLLKIALALVVARLTLNPWIADYETGSHWSFWTYGGALVCAVVASRLTLRDHAMRPWLEAASLHLLVLFLGIELRYWLYDGDIFARRFTMTEATLNTLLWGALSITYMIRSRASESLARLYRWFARALLVMAGLSYLSLMIYHNPWWGQHSVGDTPVFNLLLLAYGAPVLLAVALSRSPQLVPSHWSRIVAGVGFGLFTLLEIRHLWQGSEMALTQGMSEGELYTYSGVGLLYAIGAVVFGASKAKTLLYKAGMVLLGLVTAKIFLVDMAGLQGLWRVAAFMGLGLALLGLAWMHRRIAGPGGAISAST
ncbi:DUF2339 domain-containing protein [Marinobacter confluentis]|uniref:DUF2339 domain-containing protein n=1 Tax=Marinobacter confluentis TaxID=1697557 RepID=A0A4Z1CFM1_9GAMM|nr:DUF2339 domain-containing protein [Marinobacter confluentis]TGN38894.1 DUF2339 domain-containing protein [Marinobacter confluentis]